MTRPVLLRIRRTFERSFQAMPAFAGAAVLCLGLSACASVGSLAQANKVWVGRPLSEIISAWGPPAQSFAAEGGGSIHSWSMVIVRRRRSEECRRSLLADEEGVIRRWLYDTCPRPQPTR